MSTTLSLLTDFSFLFHRHQAARLKPQWNCFTNFIVTICRADGEKMVMTFTYDDAFRSRAFVEAMPNGPKKVAALKQLETTELSLALYGIDAETVVWIPPTERANQKSKWCPESRKHYLKAFEYFIGKGLIDPTDAWILHDAGNEFKLPLGGDSIFKQLGFDLEGIFPPDSHHALSTNDNMWHGTAKQSTRGKVTTENDVEYTLCLMRELLDVPPGMINGWFEKNCMWKLMSSDASNNADAILAESKTVLATIGERWSQYHDTCCDALYDTFPDYEEEAINYNPSNKKKKGGKVNILSD
jgi:hypothetical protein